MILNQFKIMWLRPQGVKASILLCFLSASHSVLIYGKQKKEFALKFFFLIKVSDSVSVV